MREELCNFLYKFIKNIKNNNIKLYNEFNLQFELAYFLKSKGYKVEFERNVSFFNLNKKKFIKKEIDLVIYDEDNKKIAIELKYPNNGQVPEQMFSFIRDIKFLEQLKETNQFEDGIFIVLTDNHNFWEGSSEINKLYKSFRGDYELKGSYNKPTGRKDKKIELNNNYLIKWNDLGIGNLQYLILFNYN